MTPAQYAYRVMQIALRQAREVAVPKNKNDSNAWLDLLLALRDVNTLKDMGIKTVLTMKLYATCSAHGGFNEVVDVDEDKPVQAIECPMHTVLYGAKHTCPIEAFELYKGDRAVDSHDDVPPK